jgi:L-asparaginase
MTTIQKFFDSKRFVLLLLIISLLVATAAAASTPLVKAADKPTFPIPTVSTAMKDSPLPNILVIGTGGTISGVSAKQTNFQTYRSGQISIQTMVDFLPEKDRIADVATYQFGNKGSGSWTIPEIFDLSLAVDAGLEQYDGVVVTTGTDTMEEIAYFLDLTVRSEKPVVVTGSMRPWTVIGSDAQANLYQAIKLSASGETKSFGAVVMLNDMIFPAKDVTKTDSHRMDTFDSHLVGALGYVDENKIRIYRVPVRALKAGKPEWQTPFDLLKIKKDNLPAVEIAYAYQQASGGAINGFVAEGAKGIVTAGTGAGGISSKMSAARTEAIKKGVIFVSTTRTGSGSVYSSGNGIISGDSLNPQHARLMLMLSLAFSNDFATISGWFAKYATQDIGE